MICMPVEVQGTEQAMFQTVRLTVRRLASLAIRNGNQICPTGRTSMYSVDEVPGSVEISTISWIA
jgi:hypothetical protein